MRNTKNAKGDIDMIFWDRHTGILQYIYAFNIFHLCDVQCARCAMCITREMCAMYVTCVMHAMCALCFMCVMRYMCDVYYS